MAILKFNEFINESELPKGYSSYMALPDPLKNFLTKYIKTNVFSKVIGSSYFGISLEGENLYFILNDKKIHIPFIKYIDNDVILDNEELGNFDSYKKFLPELGVSPYGTSWDNNVGASYTTNEPNMYITRIMDRLAGVKGYDDLPTSVGRLLELIITKIYDNNSKLDKSNYLNPFDTDLDENEVFKNLKMMGVSIVSTERQRKNGTIQLTADFLPYDLTINTTGYIRRLANTPSPLTNNIELSRPIYAKEDIDIKLSYIFIYCLKIILKNNGISTSTINSVAKTFTKGEYSLYDDVIKEIAKNNPRIAHVLPDPNNVISTSLKRGAAILGRFNIF